MYIWNSFFLLLLHLVLSIKYLSSNASNFYGTAGHGYTCTTCTFLLSMELNQTVKHTVCAVYDSWVRDPGNRGYTVFNMMRDKFMKWNEKKKQIPAHLMCRYSFLDYINLLVSLFSTHSVVLQHSPIILRRLSENEIHIKLIKKKKGFETF